MVSKQRRTRRRREFLNDSTGRHRIRRGRRRRRFWCVSIRYRAGTQKHGVRIHADSPDEDCKSVEMTGYFKLEEREDQFTLVARQGPTYNYDGGRAAYGYHDISLLMVMLSTRRSCSIAAAAIQTGLQSRKM